ncbi:hypothetical protein BGX27_007359 [Mortierella sp. AM989]|nr:hypothetical protein BGX27_007359 [Mortierella sp. AM989]
MSSGSANDVPFPGNIDEALGERLQPDEAEATTKIANAIEGAIHRQYEGQPGAARRDVHAKATGFLKAQFKVHEEIPAQFAKGIFIPGKSYEAILRLSNASGNAHEQDNHDDGRGFALKLLNVPGPKILESDKDATTQDFVFINHPIFFANNSQRYLEVVSKNSSDSLLQKLTIPFSLGLKGTLIAKKLSSGKIANPLQIQYFSAVPYQLGVGEGRLAVKYSVKPVSTKHDPMPHNPDHDYLHQAVKSTLAEGEVQFKFLVQPRVNQMDVEDSMTEWSQEESPFQELATITIPKQDVDSEEFSKLVERLSFNPWHSLAEHKPLGSINRTRKIVYERISRVRDDINSVPREEPSRSHLNYKNKLKRFYDFLTLFKSTFHLIFNWKPVPSLGRGGSSPRGRTNSGKVSAPLPVNLPSRRHEKAGIESLVAPGSSWGSPSTPSSAILATTSPAASSPATEGYSSMSGSGTSASAAGQGGDSPKLDSVASPPFQKATPRAWGMVAHTPEQHLEEYPTAAEAAKKTQDMHEHQHHGSTNNNNANSSHLNASTNSAKRTNTPSSTTSGEPMAKTVSALSAGADNWDEADEDESVDFLNAEAIEFADGSVNVAEVVLQTTESQKEEEPLSPAPAPSHREERVVDRGDVDFNRAWPSRPQPGNGSSLYQPNSEQSPRYGSQDRSHPSLWQGGPNDRRLSADRTQNQYPNQRRESFGSRESYQGAPRRDSLGQKGSFSGPRRDSAGYRDPQERRDSFNRTGNFNRDREPYHHRDNDYNMDRRPSHDRPPYTSDPFPDRRQRDVQLLTHPKEANDRLGPHDPNLVSHSTSYPQRHHPPPGSRGPYEPIHPRDMDNRPQHSQAHMAPPNVIEHDRPAHDTEQQHESMKHSAEEARKRLEEVEKKFEEMRARARARADELAKKAEEAKLAKAKEEEAAKEAELLEKEKNEAETKKNVEKTDATGVAALVRADLPETVREFGNPRERPHIKTAMSESERKDAMAQWQALPNRLAKEEEERRTRIQEERRLKAEQEQSSATVSVIASATPANNTTPAVGPWRRSGNSVSGKASSDAAAKSETSTKKDDKPRETNKSGSSNLHPGPQEVRVEQLEEVMHRIEESLHIAGIAAKTAENSKQISTTSESSTLQETAVNLTEFPGKSASEDSTQEFLAPSPNNAATKENSRSAKAAQPDKDRGKEETKPSSSEDMAAVAAVAPLEVTREAHTEDSTGKEMSLSNAKSEVRIANGRLSRSAAAAISKGSYPAKLHGHKGEARISQISKIHARLSLQTAGDVDLEPPSDQEDQPHLAANAPLSKESAALKSQSTSTKRNSLLSSGTPTIFPSNVEKAAKNRGRMSFMVESEIDGPSANEPEVTLHGKHSIDASSQRGDGTTALSHIAMQANGDTHSNESIKKTWDPNQSSDQIPDLNFSSKEGQHQVHHQDGINNSVSQGMMMAPGMYMMGATAPGVGSPMTHMWSAPIGVESSQAGVGIAPNGVVVAGPGGGAGGHPGQPFPLVMPYYPQSFPVNGHPMLYVYGRHMPPPLPQFPGGVMPSHGSMPISPREGVNNVNGGNIGPTDPTLSQVMPPHPSSGSDPKTENANGNGSIISAHPWLPRFSAAGDAPSQQAAAGGSFMMPVPTSQHQNILAAANINRVSHSRPFGQHHQQQQQQQLHQQHHHQHPQQLHQQQARMHGTGSASLENGFQEGSRSPPSTDGWGSDVNMVASGMNVGNQPGNNGGGRNHSQGSSGPSSSWGSGNGRNNSANGPPGSGGSYGGYQHQQSSPSSSQHSHPGGGYRGGRGSYNNGFGNHREFRSRGGYGGSHMGPQVHQHGQHGHGHSPNFHYGQHGNMTGPQQQHGGSSAGNPSGSNPMDQNQTHGRRMSNDGNSTGQSFGSGY